MNGMNKVKVNMIQIKDKIRINDKETSYGNHQELFGKFIFNITEEQ